MPFKDRQARREYMRTYMRQYSGRSDDARRAAAVAQGKCRCGRDRSPGLASCQQCREAGIKSSKARQAKRRERGVCLGCGSESGGKAKCDNCRRIAKEYLARLKLRVIQAYGGKCACCGEDEPAFLTIDHCNNDGGEHRQALGTSRIYKWLERNGFPKDRFQLLCFNCNCGRHVNGGVCPHHAYSDGKAVRTLASPACRR